MKVVLSPLDDIHHGTAGSANNICCYSIHIKSGVIRISDSAVFQYVSRNYYPLPQGLLWRPLQGC